jgi:hypothetical protein
MATEYVIADISERIRDRVRSLGEKMYKNIIFGRDFTCFIDEINCLSNIDETINNSDVTDANKDIVISDLMLRFNI